MITLTTEADQLLADFSDAPAGIQRAAVRSLNRTINSGASHAAELIADYLGTRKKDARNGLRIRQATFQRPEVAISASRKGLPLIGFAASGPTPSRGRGRGVSVRIGGKRQRFAHAFIATMGSHTGVFQMSQSPVRKSAGAWSKNLPVRELFGPSIGSALDRFRQPVLDRMTETFIKNFKHESIWQEGQAPDA